MQVPRGDALLKILCTADLHIGRRSTRLPAHLDAHAHSSAEAWRRIVDCAIAREVHVLTVAGDMIDHSNRYFEAVGAVETGLRRLQEAGITTLLVAGNHDFDVLPAVVDSIGGDRVQLLGRGGRWERVTLTVGSGRLHVDGWSFPRAHVVESPLTAYEPATDGAPTLALLHADLEQPGSRYAPVTLAEIRRTPEIFFLLGHVHAPRLLEERGGCRLLYPGSPQALDPGETGPHGVYLLEGEGTAWRAEAIPLSSVRYEGVTVDVGVAERPEEVEQRVHAALRRRLEALAPTCGGATSARFRLRLIGRSGIRKEIESRLREYAADLEIWVDDLCGTIEEWTLDLAPVHDLEALAGGIGAPAVLAEVLLGRGGSTGAAERLAEELRRLAAEVYGSRSFTEIAGGAADLEAIQRRSQEESLHAAHLLLDQLMLQKEARP
jgi:DNA repair protein SbcD/Mre11